MTDRMISDAGVKLPDGTVRSGSCVIGAVTVSWELERYTALLLSFDSVT